MVYKTINRIMLIAIISVTSSISIFSQVNKLTLEDAIKIAVERNRDAKIAEMNVDKAGAAVKEAIGNAMPSVDLGFGFNHYLQQPVFFVPAAAFNPNDSTGGLMAMKIGGTNTFEAKATLTQILFSSTVFRGIGASETYLNLSKEQYKSTISKTTLDVKKTFYGALYAQNSLEIVTAAYNNALANYENVKALHEEGFASDFDLLQTDVYVANVKPSIIQARNGYKTALDGLKLLLGMNQSDSLELSGELAYVSEKLNSSDEYIKIAQKENFDLRTLDTKKQVDEAMISLYTSEYWPTVAAFANYTYTGQSETMDFVKAKTSIVGLSVSMNIFNGFKTDRRVEQAQIGYEQSNMQYNLVREAVAMQIKMKLNDLQSIAEVIEAQNANVEKAQKAYDIALIRYKEGEGSQIEVQNTDVALLAAKNNRLQYYYNYNVAKAELENLIGSIKSEYLRRK